MLIFLNFLIKASSVNKKWMNEWINKLKIFYLSLHNYFVSRQLQPEQETANDTYILSSMHIYSFVPCTVAHSREEADLVRYNLGLEAKLDRHQCGCVHEDARQDEG
jgi:hypothetical protein